VEHLIGRGGADWRRLSAAPWVYPPGSGLSLHQDGVLYTGAFTFFAHREWRIHWGGQPEASPQIIPKISRKTACSRTMRLKAVMRGWSQSSRIVGMQSYQ
jgi:hypothetical protein